jgi:hypothetical protein
MPAFMAGQTVLPTPLAHYNATPAKGFSDTHFRPLLAFDYKDKTASLPCKPVTTVILV